MVRQSKSQRAFNGGLASKIHSMGVASRPTAFKSQQIGRMLAILVLQKVFQRHVVYYVTHVIMDYKVSLQ